MIEGVIIKPLRRIPDERGTIYKMQESTDAEFAGFGEIYFSSIYPGIVKGWHLHKTATLNYTVIVGSIKLVLFDDRESSSTRNEIQEIYIGEHNYSLIQIPPNIWNGFACVGNTMAIVADLINVPHKDDEMLRLQPHDNELIPYQWGKVDR